MKYTLILVFTLFSGEVETYPITDGYKSWTECTEAAFRTIHGTLVIGQQGEIESIKTKCVQELET